MYGSQYRNKMGTRMVILTALSLLFKQLYPQYINVQPDRSDNHKQQLPLLDGSKNSCVDPLKLGNLCHKTNETHRQKLKKVFLKVIQLSEVKSSTPWYSKPESHTSLPYETPTAETRLEDSTTESNMVNIPRAMALKIWRRKVNMVPLFGYDTPICAKHTCKHKCHMGGRKDYTECMCDSFCMIAGDCCWDYEWECFPKSQNGSNLLVGMSKWNWKSYEELLLNRNKNREFFGCFDGKTSSRSESPGLHGIISCPIGADDFIIGKCENVSPNSNNFTETTPVIVNQTVYRNIFCAFCHGKRKNHIQIAQPQIWCQNKTELRYNYKNISISGLLEYVKTSENCVLHYKLPATIARRSRCQKFVRNCPLSQGHNKTNYTKYIEEACKSHSAAFRIDKLVYNNVFCALCNTNLSQEIVSHVNNSCFNGIMENQVLVVNTENKTHCLTCRPTYLPSFSLLLDFAGSQESGDYNVDVGCPPKQVKGPDGLCNRVTCSHGMIVSNSGSCIQNPWTYLRDAVQKNIDKSSTFFIYYQLYVQNRNYNISSERYMADLLPAVEITYMGSCTDQPRQEDKQCLLYMSNSTYDIKEVYALIESATMNFTHSLNVSNIRVTTYNESSILLCQILHQPYLYSYKNSSSYFDFFENGTNNNRIGFSFSWVLGDVQKIFMREECRPCSLIELDKEKYIQLNGSIQIKKTGQVLGNTDMLLMNTSVFICIDLFDKLFHNTSLDTYRGSIDLYIQGILTVIGQALSMICLGITILVYSLLPSLRTAPGKGIMNLCSALFLAQLLFQINPKITPWPTACHVIGALQHFFWLSAFTWMTSLAFTSAMTFSQTSLYQKKHTYFVKYCVFGWGSSAIFVSISVVLDYYKIFSIRYSSNQFCWIHNRYGLVYFFAVPVGCLLLSNVVLFGIIIVGLRKVTKATSAAKSEEQCRRADHDRFLAYLKLFSIMGFSWIFGFLANFTQFDYLWYPFIILSSSQGVFILFSFALSRNAIYRLRTKYKIQFIMPKTETRNPRTTYTTTVFNSSSTIH